VKLVIMALGNDERTLHLYIHMLCSLHSLQKNVIRLVFFNLVSNTRRQSYDHELHTKPVL
jgi:hypothetical protein